MGRMPHTPTATDPHVEAARYALLRRLALGMRHHMVVHLQPMGLITELMERRLKLPEPPWSQIHASMEKIHGLSRAAVDSCLDVVTWLAPAAGVRIGIDDGVAEVTGLLRSNFSFRGFVLVENLGGIAADTERSAVRHVLPAVLLALTDRAPTPAQVRVTTSLEEGCATVAVEVEPTTGEPGFPGNHPYRLLGWTEVDALALAEGVEVRRSGSGAYLRFP